MKKFGNWIINNGWLVFILGCVAANYDHYIPSFIGVGLMLFSFYLMYLGSKQEKKWKKLVGLIK